MKILEQSIENSILVPLIKNHLFALSNFKREINMALKDSQIYCIAQKFYYIIKFYMKSSFFGKVSERFQLNDMVLSESRVVRRLNSAYRNWRMGWIRNYRTSRIIDSARKLKADKSFIFVVAVITNIVFSVVFKKEVGAIGWIVRGLLLAAGGIGLSFHFNWEEVGRTSYLVRYINNKPCKI